MSLEVIGIITLLVGFAGLFAGQSFSTYAFVFSTLLGAAAASILTSLGSANLPPAHVLLGFLFIRLGLDRDQIKSGLASLAYPRPGFWLLLATVYAVFASFFMPRIFQGASYVFAIARTEAGTGIVLTPLGPVSGNVTQTIYFVGDLICFVIFYVTASSPAGTQTLARAAIACGLVNIGLGALDYFTFATGTADLMSFMRNATYTMLYDTEVMGFKRLVGSFPEASSYAYATLGLFAFNMSLWLNGFPSRLPVLVALLSLAALLMSTSTTAYAGLSGYLVLIYLGSIVRVAAGAHGRTRLGFVLFTPLIILVFVAAIQLNDQAAVFLNDVVDKTILTKLSTDSGIERSNWNSQALQNFFDTYGFGAGVGSVRASSFPVAVLSNLGVFGAVTYGLFIIGCIRGPGRVLDPSARRIKEAAASSCMALLMAAAVAGTTVDLGLAFFVFAALAAAPAEATESARPSPARSTLVRPLSAREGVSA